MTKPWHDMAAQAWRTLQLGGGSPELSVATVPLSLDTGLGPVRMAMREGGEPRLLIPTDIGRRLPDGLSGRGIRVRVLQLVVGSGMRAFIEIGCAARELDDVFRSLIDDILRRLEAGIGPELAVSQAIAEFRELLSGDPAQSLETLIGLFGELNVLKALLELNPTAASMWTGPLGRYDFAGQHQCAEVKSTLQRVGAVIRVSNLDQLQAPDDGLSLILVHTVLERSGAGGRSVQNLIEDVYRLSSTPEVLDRALAWLGLIDWRTRHSIAIEKFRVVRQNFYEIRSGFPCLTAMSLRTGHPAPGIFDISYSLDLTHAEAFRVPPTQTAPILQRLATTS